MNQNFLAEDSLGQLLEKVDNDLARECKERGCPRCGDTLHWDNYPRKPRGGPEHWTRRHSFTCATHRHRTTPPSVRFLGRKVYVAVVVVLMTAMSHGLSARRVCCLKEHLQVDRRTLEHWRRWWREHFVQSAFWKLARASLAAPLDEATLPLGLCERFDVACRDRLLKLLEFLSPITTTSTPFFGGF